jgi:DNA invertase Pin-like site-specific DNA recombinase
MTAPLLYCSNHAHPAMLREHVQEGRVVLDVRKFVVRPGKPFSRPFRGILRDVRKGRATEVWIASLPSLGPSSSTVYDRLAALLNAGATIHFVKEEWTLSKDDPRTKSLLVHLRTATELDRRIGAARVARMKARGRKPGPKPLPVDRKALRRMVKGNWTLDEMAHELGVSKMTVWRRLRELDLMTPWQEDRYNAAPRGEEE